MKGLWIWNTAIESISIPSAACWTGTSAFTINAIEPDLYMTFIDWFAMFESLWTFIGADSTIWIVAKCRCCFTIYWVNACDTLHRICASSFHHGEQGSTDRQVRGPRGPCRSAIKKFSFVRVRSGPRVLEISWSASGPVRGSQNFLGPRPVRSADHYFFLGGPVRGSLSSVVFLPVQKCTGKVNFVILVINFIN